MAERLLKTIRAKSFIKPGDRVAAAVSGGADSVALLFLLIDLRSELGIVLSAVHVNHRLRGDESDGDQAFVAAMAQGLGLEIHCFDAPISGKTDSGVEAAARELRYGIFRTFSRDKSVPVIATAHTLDDQAETVLLRALRGTGIGGLAGIQPRLTLEVHGKAVGEVIRPLLDFRHGDLEEFLRERKQGWREDSSNRDLSFLRNRVRHQVLPLLKASFGPSAIENLAALAEIARAEEDHWNAHPEIHAEVGALPVSPLRQLPLAVQRRLIRNWLRENAADANVTFRHIEDVRALAGGPPGRQIELSGGKVARRGKSALSIEPADADPPTDYAYTVSIPGQIEIAELGVRMEVVKANPRLLRQSEFEQRLDPARLPQSLTIRNWRSGDRFWPAHTREAKKVKELLSARHLTGTEKKLWPVAAAEGMGLVWMRGFPVPDALRPAAVAGEVVCIREVPNAYPARC
ncbi:MAG TPA: tRNA lysidine(34) synthetase TilS [Methylomirabilota bacterium]|nr:tRNA lysidine(34) synthetase TilS [Methylomirabilota bacterium]